MFFRQKSCRNIVTASPNSTDSDIVRCRPFDVSIACSRVPSFGKVCGYRFVFCAASSESLRAGRNLSGFSKAIGVFGGFGLVERFRRQVGQSERRVGWGVLRRKKLSFSGGIDRLAIAERWIRRKVL